MMLSSVDLPQPEGPSRQTNSPSLTSRSMSSSTVDLLAVPLEYHVDVLGAAAWSYATRAWRTGFYR